MGRRSASALWLWTLVAIAGAAEGGLCEPSPENAIRQAIARYVVRARQAPAEQIEVTCGAVPAALTTAAMRADSLHVRPVNSHDQLLGKTLFVVEALSGGAVTGRWYVLATVRVFAEVVVARRRLNRHELLSVADLTLEWREITKLRGAAVRTLAEALGRRTKRMVAQGETLRYDELDRPPMVKQGEVVTLMVETKNLNLTMKATALQDGSCGDRIAVRVEGNSGRQRYFAEVKEPGLVVLRP
ncbi:MAG: flagellar basal body P-ring formation chaperone FlgA [Candidatus Oleimicrobiaceae bacterium]